LTNYKGYVGKILRVDLSTGKTWKMKIDDDFAEKWIGGRGFIAKILYDELEPGTDPLGPKNKLIFMTGPLAGTHTPYGKVYGRHEITSDQNNLSQLLRWPFWP